MRAACRHTTASSRSVDFTAKNHADSRNLSLHHHSTAEHSVLLSKHRLSHSDNCLDTLQNLRDVQSERNNVGSFISRLSEILVKTADLVQPSINSKLLSLKTRKSWLRKLVSFVANTINKKTFFGIRFMTEFFEWLRESYNAKIVSLIACLDTENPRQ